MTTLEQTISIQLERHGARLTRGRRRVVDALADADGPRSVAELKRELGEEMPLSSLYRSLAVLEEAGVVTPHLGTRGVVRYELAEWLTGHHHHLVCVDCGTVEDISLPKPHEDAVQKLVEEISASSSYVPLGHALEIEGRCPRCA